MLERRIKLPFYQIKYNVTDGEYKDRQFRIFIRSKDEADARAKFPSSITFCERFLLSVETAPASPKAPRVFPG